MGVVGRLNQYASMQAAEFDDYSMSENLLTYSEDFGNARWLKQPVGTALAPVVTTNQGTAPDGTLTADKVVFDLNGSVTSNDRSQLYQIFSTVTGTTYTFSTWMRSEDGVSRIVRISFSGLSPLDVVVTSSWQRFSVTATAIDTIRYPRYELRVGTPTSTFASVYIWGAQLEESSAVTDYTPTTTTAKIRVLSSTTNTNISGLGTYYSSGFDENVGFTTFLSANISAPYDPVYDEFGGTFFGAGQGRYMRQNTDKSVIVYNEIDEVTPII